MHKGIDLAIKILDTIKEELKNNVNIVVTATEFNCKIKLPNYVSLENLNNCKYVKLIEFSENNSIIHASIR